MKCTSDFLKWINSIDRSLRIRIDQRIQRLEDGNPGSHKSFDGISELKWSTGAMGSFRIYYFEHEGFILLLGGHKDTQNKDIKKAILLLEDIKNGEARIEDYE